MSKEQKTLLLIDSFALIFRAYYAFPPSLKSADGLPTNAVYGFTSLLLDIILKFKPTDLVAVFDSEGPTIRKTNHSYYKANRSEADELLLQQIPLVRDILNSLDIPVLNVDGYEADDIIGTLIEKHSNDYDRIIVVTGDQDLFQLVKQNVFVFLAGRRFAESKLYDRDGIFDKLKIYPEQIVDYKAIKGDPSDNIPGVKGIGDKGALELIHQFGSVEKIIENIDLVKDSLREKLINGMDLMLESQKLATVDRFVPLSFDFKSSEFLIFNKSNIASQFQKYNFVSLEKKINQIFDIYHVEREVDKQFQLMSETLEEATKLKAEEVVNTKSDMLFIIAEYTDVNLNCNNLSLKNYKLKFKDNESIFESNDFSILKKTLENSQKIILCDIKPFIHALKNIGFQINLDKCEDLKLIKYLYEERISGVYSLNLLEDNFLSCYSQLISDSKLKTLYEIEKRVLYTVLNMEQKGIILDEGMLKEFEQVISKIREELIKTIFQIVGFEFNINSPRQIGEILFQKRGLPVLKKNKTGPSTDEQTLEKLKDLDPLVHKILEYREVDKILNTYLQAFPKYVDKDKRIRAVFDQTGSVSGRFSSKNPNMQNIPVGEILGVNLRNCFSSGDGKIFLGFDYSQQELRILAALSEEEKMITAFEEGIDIHQLTASEIFEKSTRDVSKEERDIGKVINFSIIYGISPFSLGDRLKISVEMAKSFIDKFFVTYPGIRNFIDKTLKFARQNGYTETYLGRRRSNLNINSRNFNLKSASERELFNFVIQGTAADIMKIVMSKLPDLTSEFRNEMVLQIHDEFIFEVDEFKLEDGKIKDKRVELFVSEVYNCMISSIDIGVKFSVDLKYGQRWGSLQKLDL